MKRRSKLFDDYNDFTLLCLCVVQIMDTVDLDGLGKEMKKELNFRASTNKELLGQVIEKREKGLI